MSCSALIMRFLSDNGVSNMFGIPGYANGPLFIATRDFPEIKAVLTRHEANAAWMAYGYAQISGRFGVCTGTSGAGTTNIASAVAAAYYNSIPVLVLTGQVERAKFGKGGFQELTGTGARSVSVMSLFQSMTKMSVMLEEAEELPYILGQALAAMTTGRPGPVHINIPVDVLKEKCADDWVRADLPPLKSAAHASVLDAKAALAKAKSPLLLFGRGATRAKALVREFTQVTGLPYCTTLQGRGLVVEEAANFMGVVGVAGSPRCNAFVADDCDLILAIGTSLGEFTTNGYATNFCRAGRLIHVDIDPREFGKSVPPRLTIEADAGDFLKKLLAEIRGQPLTTPRLTGALRTPVGEITPEIDRIGPLPAMELIAEYAPNNTIFLADSGNNAVWAAHYLGLKERQEFLIDINTGCMGSGVVSAIGAQMAAPSRPVIAICGDGGFMMNGVDVATAVQENLPIVWVVMNDAKLGMVDQGFRNQYGGTVACEFSTTNIAAMAKAYGADALEINTTNELRSALQDLKNRWTSGRPLVLDVRFDDRYLPSVYGRVKENAKDRDFATRTAQFAAQAASSTTRVPARSPGASTKHSGKLHDHQNVIRFADKSLGFEAIVALHRPLGGMAMGGTRLLNYSSEQEALADAMRLSEALTYKAACAGLPVGGAKAVIRVDPRRKTPALLRAYARFIESLDGQFITGQDLNMTMDDVRFMATVTKYMVGYKPSNAGPGAMTADGVLHALTAALAYRYGDSNLSKLRIAIQGVGDVGCRIAKTLAEQGAALTITDIDEERAQALGVLTGAKVVSPGEIYAEPFDVFMPCARGGVLNPATIPALKGTIVVGAANNQLENTERDSALIAAHNVLYCPDFVVNAGGLIEVYNELIKAAPAEAPAMVFGIAQTTTKILEAAEELGISTHAAALHFASQKREELERQLPETPAIAIGSHTKGVSSWE